MRSYSHNKKAGAVQEAMLPNNLEPSLAQHAQLSAPNEAQKQMRRAPRKTHAAPAPMQDIPPMAGGTLVFSRAQQTSSHDPHTNPGWSSMFFYTVREGQRVLVIAKSGKADVVEGPMRVWRWGKRVESMAHHVAHPGDFLIVRFRDGRQEHMAGPAHCWLDTRSHISVTLEEAVQIAAKEAVVVYAEEADGVKRRVVHGPATFVPSPGEWLHEFSWHGPAPEAVGFQKIPGALVFQKLWMMPDQMYHDVVDVRTADDAVLTIRLMIFFELVDIETMLATTHDPIGDFVNAATSDVVDFVGKLTFDDFKSRTDRLNGLESYTQLTTRASQCGYKIDKVVYRGYGAPPALQRLHDEATENRVRLQLQRATEQQAQELEDFKLDRSLERGEKERRQAAAVQAHQLDLAGKRETEEAARLDQRRTAERAREVADAAVETARLTERKGLERAHYAELGKLGVDLTALLTTARADRVVEVRGGVSQLHLRDP